MDNQPIGPVRMYEVYERLQRAGASSMPVRKAVELIVMSVVPPQSVDKSEFLLDKRREAYQCIVALAREGSIRHNPITEWVEVLPISAMVLAGAPKHESQSPQTKKKESTEEKAMGNLRAKSRAVLTAVYRIKDEQRFEGGGARTLEEFEPELRKLGVSEEAYTNHGLCNIFAGFVRMGILARTGANYYLTGFGEQVALLVQADERRKAEAAQRKADTKRESDTKSA